MRSAGQKARNLRNWLTIYSYWNQGGLENVATMLLYLVDNYSRPIGVPTQPLLETPPTGQLSHITKSLSRVLLQPLHPQSTPLLLALVVLPFASLWQTSHAPGPAPACGQSHAAFIWCRANALHGCKAWRLPAGCLHPDHNGYFSSPRDYMAWYAKRGPLRGDRSAPTVAVLLYRKHVITAQPYIGDLIRTMEAQGVRPIPIFINGIEAHTVVRLI